jgi:hypothetical protein
VPAQNPVQSQQDAFTDRELVGFNVTSSPRDRVKCAHDLLLPSASLQWVCYKRQFQRQSVQTP